MHKPYSEIVGHQADFRVKYKFYTQDEGGRKIIPYQGIRCDFVYEISDKKNQTYMIWPEFEDEHGKIILDNTRSVPQSGTAKMWIINEKMRAFFILNELRLDLNAIFGKANERPIVK